MNTERRSCVTPDDFHSIISTSIDGFLFVDLGGNILETNDSYCQTVGYSRDELLNLDISFIDAIDSKDDVAKRFELIIQKGSLRFETKHRHKNGNVIDIEVSANYSPAQGGSIFSFIRDISDKKQTENRRRQVELALEESEWKFQALFDNGPIGVAYHRMIYDNSGKAVDYLFLDVNDKYLELTGVDPRDKTVTQAFPGIENDPFDWIGTFGKVARTGESIRFEQYLELNDRWYDCVGYQYKPDHFVAAFLEITDRKKAEAVLLKTNEVFSLFMRHSPIYVFIKEVTPTGSRVLQASDNFQEMVGIKGSDMIGKTMEELFPPEFAAKISADDRNVVAKGDLLKIDEELNGRSYTTVKFPLTQEGNTLLAGFTIDITERKQIEDALRQSEATFRKLFEDSSDAILLIDSTGVFVKCNQAALDLLKMTSEQFLLLSPARISPEFQPDGRRSDEAALEMISLAYSKGLHRFDWTCVNAEGGEFIVEVSLMPITIKGQTMLHNTWRNITERKRVERGLQLSEQKFSTIFNLMPDIVGITLMADGCFIEVNDGFERWTGWSREEALGKSSLDLGVWSPEARAKAVVIMQENGRLDEFEFMMTTKTGEQRNALMYLLPIIVQGQKCLFFLARDVTEFKRAVEDRIDFEKQLLHAQKLESLGVLAGGIAHDFNNLLMVIMGNADLALIRLNPESPAVDNLKRIEEASARAADLAKQMLAYSGKGKFVVEPLDMSRLVEEMLHMLEVSISKKAVLRFNLTKPTPSVEADATQMRQIIMNLVINASEAIGDKSGVIAITTGCMDCDRNYLKDVWLDENISAGLYVFLEIADSGCGMDKATMTKLFDPFFTTKFTGRGLGMAAVLGIVRGHKGAIKVYSELNRGTTFKILLPASDRPVELFNGHDQADNWQGSGKVLLVDDEETVRGIGSEMLKELGFTVITADDGREAVAAFKRNPDIAFVILDLTMPHMDGEQCFRELKQLKPDVKVMISSGYSEHEVSIKFAGKGLAGFIQKPYKLSMLKEAIRKI